MIIKTPVVKPFAMKTTRVLIQLDGETDVDDWSDHIDEISITPSLSGSSTFTAVSGAVIQDPGSESWAMGVNLIQDLDPAGLLRWLLTHTGQKATVRARFAAGTTDELVATVTLTSSGFGGKAATLAASTGSWAIDGVPAFETALA